MAKISKNFTYNLADDYLAQTNDLGKTNQWTYEGPDKIWVFVDEQTNRVNEYPFVTIENDGPTYPTPLGFVKVEVDCDENPLLCSLLRANEYQPDGNDFPQHQVKLPDGRTYTRPKNPDPYHTYEAPEVEYKDGQWVFPWKKPWMSWEEIYKIRDERVKEAELEMRTLTTLPESLKQKLEDYIDSLKNIETEWAEYEPYMYVFPDYPL